MASLPYLEEPQPHEHIPLGFNCFNCKKILYFRSCYKMCKCIYDRTNDGIPASHFFFCELCYHVYHVSNCCLNNIKK